MPDDDLLAANIAAMPKGRKKREMQALLKQQQENAQPAPSGPDRSTP
ncbi:hypothetical protein [Sphingomonas aquatilis]|uniref:Uncharacterized protein n=1 Tax=Sphingomonas aquatilis TaxID=93063 RepID=A0AAW3TSM9_9SPHN|nr:hypothetical protein [Sphingomonas aquatilis]MBB3876075.1 hypothetical protein [Sphingomonas aquatilis]